MVAERIEEDQSPAHGGGGMPGMGGMGGMGM
jgi:hypothetical protein